MPGHETAVYVAVGANVDPEENILRAFDLLAQKTRVVATSTFYRNAPADGRSAPDFVNGVWKTLTVLTPREFKFGVLRKIEERLGRVRTSDRFAPRPIDLDPILAGAFVSAEIDLVLPDPGIRSRPFIAVPLFEIGPDLILPDTGEALSSLASVRSTRGLTPVAALSRQLTERLTP